MASGQTFGTLPEGFPSGGSVAFAAPTFQRLDCGEPPERLRAYRRFPGGGRATAPLRSKRLVAGPLCKRYAWDPSGAPKTAKVRTISSSLSPRSLFRQSFTFPSRYFVHYRSSIPYLGPWRRYSSYTVGKPHIFSPFGQCFLAIILLCCFPIGRLTSPPSAAGAAEGGAELADLAPMGL